VLASIAVDLAPIRQNAGGGANPSACDRELRKLGPRRLGEKHTAPLKVRHAWPTWPPIPDETTGNGVWIGEVLIDATGRVSQVWTIREALVTPPLPSLNKAISDAVVKWEYVPAAEDDIPVPVCRTVSVAVNLTAIRNGRLAGVR
jgi:hypothetical protein